MTRDTLETLGMILPSYVQQAAAYVNGARQALARREGWALEVMRYAYLGSGLAEMPRSEGWAGTIVGPLEDREASFGLPVWRESPVPVVSLRVADVGDLPVITADYAACGTLAADHLIDCGYARLVFLAAGDQPQSDAVWRGFADQCQRRGGEPHRFDEGPRTHKLGRWRLTDQLADLAELIAQADRPLGMFGVDGTHGERLLRAATLARRRVPEDVGVIAIESDELFCQCCGPSLSSVTIDHTAIGKLAAEAIMASVDSSRPLRPHTTAAPAHLITRQSTDHTAVDDPDVAQAVRYIRQNITRLVTLEELAGAIDVSRSTLVRRFAATLGRSPADEIRRLRMAHVQDLLLRTQWPLARIAYEAGFNSVSHLANAFRRATGTTPTAFRRQSAAR